MEEEPTEDKKKNVRHRIINISFFQSKEEPWLFYSLKYLDEFVVTVYTR